MSWIWVDDKNRENDWVCFVKDYYVSYLVEKVSLKISTDTKYWLYINDNLVIFEGGIKRGPGFKQTYYDVVDITKYIIKGYNRIGILVWYFGKCGFSHCSSGHGGLFVKSDNNIVSIETDNSWYAIRHPAFIDDDPNDIKPNFRLAEPNIYYDASKEIGEWWKRDYDVSSWNTAISVNADYFGDLVERGIPFWKDYGITSYLNSDEYIGRRLDSDTVIEMKLPYNLQLTPVFEIEAEGGRRVDVFTDTYNTYVDTEKNNKLIYYTKEGIQRFESFGWINGEKVYYTFPKNTVIHSLQYRETGYKTEFVKEFRCKDAFFNKLFEKSRRTLYITMRDTFMDCPDRERVQWWGDVTIEMQMLFHCLDDNALLLYEKGVRSMANWAEHFGTMMTVVPSGTQQFELPMQNLAGIYGFYFYYERTGKTDFLKIAYPMSRDYILSYNIKDNMVEHKKGSWDWADWGNNADVSVMENAWYILALDSCIGMAETLELTDDVCIYQRLKSAIKDNFYNKFWKGNGFYYNTENGEPDDRANALAFLAGLVKDDDKDIIHNILVSTFNSSPYMEKYVLDALCKMGYLKDALKRIKYRYKDMVYDEGSTLWEYWNKDGTKNHAWSGGPLIIFKEYEKEILELIEAEEI